MGRYNKDILNHPEFYIVKFTQNLNMPYILFIHGGPGFNCGVIEYLIDKKNFFSALNYNIILYDQRNCGKSQKTPMVVSHRDNIEDLEKVISYIEEFCGIKPQSLIGHSYGAKLLFDYYKKFSSSIPGVFVSIANSILTPRLNNLMLDLSYLKKNNVVEYNKLINVINDLDLNKIWEISEQLTHLFQENKERPYLYWANLKCFHMVQDIQKRIRLPIDIKTFISVRKDLYSSELNFPVDIDSLGISKLRINGFHDFVMDGHEVALSKNNNVVTFFKSAHYPHIEENNHFSEILNEFIKHS